MYGVTVRKGKESAERTVTCAHQMVWKMEHGQYEFVDRVQFSELERTSERVIDPGVHVAIHDGTV